MDQHTKITFTGYTTTGYSKLNDMEQMKEALFIYGYCVARFAQIDNFFLIKLRFNFYFFEAEAIGQKHQANKIEKFENHLNNEASLGRLLKDFERVYNIGEFKPLFKELNHYRNVTVHELMRDNWHIISDRLAREKLYGYLLEVFRFLDDFDVQVKGHFFSTISRPDFQIRWNPDKI